MANLKELIDRVGVLLDHAPRTIDVREARAAAINRRYLDVNASYDWLNLQVEADYDVYYNRTGTDTGYTVGVTNGSPNITFSSSLGDAFTEAAGGMVFEDSGGAKYTINRFTSTTLGVLSQPYEGSTSLAMSSWTIRAERFLLPYNAAAALRFLDRENGVGVMQILDRRIAEDAFATQQSTGGTPYWMVDDEEVYDRAPWPGMAAAAGTASGTLTASATYEVCYTRDLQGRESAPSVAVRVTMGSGATNQIDLTGLENTQFDGDATGIYKNIYIRHLTTGTNNETNGVWTNWRRVTQITTESTTTYTITAFPADSAATLYPSSGRKYMRTEWVPESDQTLRLRFLRAPGPLVADSDSPEWPAAFHDILAYGAAIDIGMQQSISDSKLRWLQSLHDPLLKRFMSAKINVPDAPARRRMRRIGPDWTGEWRVNGTLSGDFSG